MTNSAIADFFSLLAKLADIHGENSFKIKSYSNAAFQIDRMEQSLADMDRNAIASQKGIGDSIAAKIIELLDTGTMASLDQLIQQTPPGILELMHIKGIGPKKIATIWRELAIESPGELLYACHENRLVHYKGFGAKTQESIKQALEYYMANQHYFLYAALAPYAPLILMQLQLAMPGIAIYLSGDIAMQQDTITHIDLVAASHTIPVFPSCLSLVKQEQDVLHLLYEEKVPVLLHLHGEQALSAHLKLSSSNTFLETLTAYNASWMDKAKSLQEEAHLFESLDLPFIPAYLRHHSLEEAMHKLPHVIQVGDIRGVIHNHSTWSDGAHSIADMAQACIDRGYEYLVMSDHSVSSFYANGLSVERIRAQHLEIDKLNANYDRFRIFKSIECDILGDGRLDYEVDVLSSFDLVIASIHQNLSMTEEKAMQRLTAAIRNPYTSILGHPSGRLLLSRKPYPVDYTALIALCKEHDVVIEINANPRRLDLDWQYLDVAVNQGVLLSINPDAHHTDGIRDIDYGVWSAQKAGLRAVDNLSSFSLVKFQEFLHRQHQKRKSNS